MGGIRLRDSDIKELRDIEVPMIGRLATEDEIENPISEATGGVRFFITPLCDDPETLEDINSLLTGENEKALYIAFDTVIKQLLPMEYKYETYDRRRALKEYLENKLIIFNTQIRVNEEIDKNQFNGYKQCKIFKNIQPQKIINNSYGENEFFIKVPVLNISSKDFISKLKNKEYIEFIEYQTCHQEPKYILCENNMYIFKNGSWKKHDTNKKMWSYIGNINNIEIAKLKDKVFKDNEILKYSNYIDFFTRTSIENIDNTINIEELVRDEEEQINDTINLDTEQSETGKKEIDFIKGLKIYCEDKGLYYKYEDIINLQISIKTNLITIISGMTGTGKSQLAWAYAKMIDASRENENLIFIPITPTYLEPSDLLGYYNPMNGLYIPTETGLIDFLVKAENNVNKQYLIIFDEMNLSQVEHWFAPFISLLETDEENRYLHLYSKNNRCINEEKYPSKIKIGNNIRILGTINLDETVKEFSDRLLDRANVIQLEKKKFSELEEIMSNKNDDDLYEKYICRDLEEYNTWIKSYNTIEVLKNELSFFDDFHKLISYYDPRKGISFRVVNSIAAYIANIPKDEEGNLALYRGYAIDLQVKQRIISKLKGTKRIIGNLIGEYDFEKQDIVNSSLINFLKSSSNISDFSLTIDAIKLKAKELALYGYTY